jgi:rubrerythrin
MTDAETENAQLRARIQELERLLYPPPPPPKKVDDKRRYFLAAAGSAEFQEPWANVHELFVGWAYDYARERHPDLQWARAYRWADIPEHGIYTTVGAAQKAKQAQADVPLYAIDQRTGALAAIDVQQQRVRDREHALLDELPRSPDREQRLRDHRIWAHRNQILSDASKRLWRPFKLACQPLADYHDLIQAATRIADEALQREPRIELTDLPGYRPDGAWTCEDCGYPFGPPFDDEPPIKCFSCRPCAEADPVFMAQHEQTMAKATRATE